MHDFKKLEVWSKSMTLATQVYELTKNFPEEEKFGLISQMRRCSVSIPSNIAEGAGRKGDKEFANFISIALGSAFELETQLLLSERLKFVEKHTIQNLLDEVESVCKMLHSLKKRFV